MPSFFDLQRYAATGIASPDMTAFDKMRALAAFGGSTVQTLTGIPPLTFKADGTPLISWSMKGNGQQTGTPTPDNPVMPTFCGVRTANLFDKTKATQGMQWGTGGTLVPAVEPASSWYATDLIEVESLRRYIRSYDGTPVGNTFFEFDIDKNFIRSSQSGAGMPINTSTNGKYIAFNINTDNAPIDKYMLNKGTTALPYEPFGYKIPISCAGQTVPVYLGQTQTVWKIRKLVLDGNENWYTEGSDVFYTDPITETVRHAPICSHYAGVYNLSDNNQATVSQSLRINIKTNAVTHTASDFKAYLASEYAAGHPVTIWYVLSTPETGIVNEPLAKIGDYADELHSTDAGVTIPTVRGNNTLTVETELQPSEMSITYRG